MDLLHDATPALQALSMQTQTTTYLKQRDGDELVDLCKFEPKVPLHVKRLTGTRCPLTYGVVGRVYLAYLPAAEVERLLAEQPLQRYTEFTVVDPAAYRAELALVRERGYGLVRDEVNLGVTAFAAPLWDYRGDLVAVIALCAPTVQVPPARIDDLGQALLRTAREISDRLGHSTTHDVRSPMHPQGWFRRGNGQPR